MTGSPHDKLHAFTPHHDFFVGIDSDGCVFPTMELKQKECFIPNIIKHWKLQSISKYVREAAEFVNLYSKWRGTNRFPAVIKTFELCRERPEVQRSGIPIPELREVREFIDSGLPLGNPGLKQMIEKTDDPVLKDTLEWSEAVNAAVTDMVKGVAPFAFVRECIDKLSPGADIIVVSATPCEALDREWAEHGMADSVAVIAGQEMGTKTEHLRIASGGKYAKNHVLMIGDAPGDLRAARANDALFYPVNPGHEEASWERFLNEAADRFLDETYAGEYETKLIEEFDRLLPDTPPWKA